jgi:hypothetical protein
MVIGSLVSGTCSWWAERGIRRSAAVAAARAAAIRARGRPLRPGEDAAVTRAAAARHDRARWHRRWAGPAALAAAAFIGCAVAVTLVEQDAGKPLSALVQGKPGHGTTLGGAGGGIAPGRPAPSLPASTTGLATTPADSTTPTSSTTPASSTTTASSSPAGSPTPAATTPGGAGPAASTLPSAGPTGRLSAGK